MLTSLGPKREFAGGISGSGASAHGPLGRVLRGTITAAMALPLLISVAGAASIQPELPLTFEPNAGQWNPRISFVARAPGWQIAFTDRGQVIHTSRGEVSVEMVGARKIAPEGAGPAGAVSHYFTGAVSEQWRANVRHVQRVLYRNVYPGIDASFYGNRKDLEYDLIVAPGADPSRIQFRFRGARSLRIDEHGDLVIGSGAAPLRQRRPRIYQAVEGGKREIAGGYVLLGRSRVGLRLEAYDHARQLVIDPVVLSEATIGGTAADRIFAIGEDQQGFVYIAGNSASTDFPVTGGSAYQGSTDAFIAKLNPAMTALVYCTYLGGNALDEALGLVVDATGRVHVVGDTSSPNFPTTSDARQRSYGGNTDGFLAVLDPNGNLQFSTYLGAAGTDVAQAIAIDSAGNRYIGGVAGAGFPVTADAVQHQFGGVVDAFYAKINSSNQIAYATYLGGSGADVANALVLDNSGNIYLAGLTNSLDFPVTAGALQRVYGGGQSDGFAAKITADGKTLNYATYLGGRDQDALTGIAVASDGSAYVGGSTASDDLHPTQGAFQATYGGSGDALFARINSTGTALSYFSYVGGTGPDFGTALAASPEGSVYMPMGSSSPGFSPGPLSAIVLFRYVPPQPLSNQNAFATGLSVSTPKDQAEGTGSVLPVAGGQESSFDPTAALAAALSGDFSLILGGYTDATGRSVGKGCPRPKSEAVAHLSLPRDKGTGCDDQGLTVRVETIPKPDQSSGNTPNAQKQGDPVSTATGELTDETTDLDLGGPLPLRFRRTYASLLRHNGLFSSVGLNWMHNFESYLSVTGNSATVIFYPGERIAFSGSGGTWHVAPEQTYNHQLIQASDGSFRFLDIRTSRVYTFSNVGLLNKIEDRNGNALTVTYTGDSSLPFQVDDGLGRTLKFSHTAGELLSVSDQTGRTVQFVHSGELLTSATDAAGNTSSYSYSNSGSYSGLLTSFTEPAQNTILTQQFDTQGRVASQADALGHTTEFDYSRLSSGITTVTDPTGAASQYTHSNFNWTAVKDALNAAASFSYDSRSRPTVSTDRAGNSRSLKYDPVSGLPSSVSDELGNLTNYAWTPQTQGGFTFYNLSKISYPDGTSTSYTYDPSGNFLSYLETGGKALTFTYNNRGQYLTAKNESGGTYKFTYNNDATMASIESPTGSKLQFSYDSLKRRNQVQIAGAARAWTWDADDRVTSITFGNGKSIQLGYDANGRLTSFIDRSGNKISTAFNANDEVTAIIDPLGQTFKFEYDARGQLSSIADPTGVSATFGYDAVGNLSTITDAAGNVQKATYDAEGRPLTYTDPLNRTTKLAIDKDGRFTGVTTPLGAVSARAFDSMGRVTSITDPDGLISTYAFEPRGMISQIVYPGSRNLGLTWDEGSRLTAIADPIGNQWTRTYDNASRLISEKDPGGNVITYGYDAADRVNAASYTGGSLQITYDSAGNVVSQAYSGAPALTYTYDASGRPTGGPGVALTYDPNGLVSGSNGLAITRDGGGRIVSITYAKGKTVTYAYDNLAQLTKVTDWAGGVTSFAYDKSHELISVTRPNGVVTQFTYDGDARMASRTDSKAATVIGTISVTRSPSGRILSETRQLPQSAEPVSGTLALKYDSAQQVSGSKYDGLGRITSDALLAYKWNTPSQLASYTGATGHASFTYDTFGGRTSRTGNDGKTSNYILNYGLPLMLPAILQRSGADLRYYVALPNGALLYSLEAADNSRRFFHFDFAGSTTFITNDNGAVTDSYAFTPYGETVSHSGTSDNPFTYLGQMGVMQEEASGLYYMRFRYYDSTTARFLSRDLEEEIDPVHVNPYQYASEDPISRVDPSGLQDKKPPDKPLEDAQKQLKDLGDKTKKYKDYADKGVKVLDHFQKKSADDIFDGKAPTTPEELQKVQEKVNQIKQDAESADKLKQVSKGLEKGGKIIDAASKGLTVIEKGMELQEKINRAEDERDNNTNLNEHNRDTAIKNVRDLYQKGKITKDRQQALLKQIDDAFRTSQEATEGNQVTDLLKGGAEFVDDTLSSLVGGKAKTALNFFKSFFPRKDPSQTPADPPPANKGKPPK